MTEEQEYKQYIYNNLIIQICESLNICSREFFIIKYNLSLDEINHINNVFKEIVTKNILDYTIFKNKIQEGIPRFNSDDVFQTLLESYKSHQPIAQKIKKILQNDNKKLDISFGLVKNESGNLETFGYTISPQLVELTE